MIKSKFNFHRKGNIMNELRKGRLDITPHYFLVDFPFYKQYLRDFLPDKIIDIHVHSSNNPPKEKTDCFPSFWPEWVTFGCGMPLPNLLDAYLKLFPGKEIFPVCFPNPTSDRENLMKQNRYLASQLKEYKHVFGFLLTSPEWSKKELSEQMRIGRFSGIKPYLNTVTDIPVEQITIFDFLPHHHLELAEEKRWIVMLHIPRKERLADEVNIAQIQEICQKYPSLNLIIAHVGRAYCTRYAKEGLPKLRGCDNLLYDISANCNQTVFEMLIEEVGPKRILFGSDLPIVAMRAKRKCEGDEYVNYIRHADWEDNRTRRCPEEEDSYTFFLYEEILAFRKAAESCELTKSDIENVFFNNAYRLLTQ